MGNNQLEMGSGVAQGCFVPGWRRNGAGLGAEHLKTGMDEDFGIIPLSNLIPGSRVPVPGAAGTLGVTHSRNRDGKNTQTWDKNRKPRIKTQNQGLKPQTQD